MPNPLEVTVVLPCLNEAASLAQCIERAKEGLRTAEVQGEILVADNGSTDGSRELAQSLGARVIAVKDKGYGHALLAGFEASEGDFIIMGDADGSYDFRELPVFIEKLRAGHDVVLGNRFLGGIRPGAMPWKNRYLGNPVLSWLGNLFFPTPCRDFHCGLRGLRRASLHALDLRTGGMEFATEMVVKAKLAGLRLAEVPCTLSPDTRGRAPHLRPWRDGWRHLRFLLLLSPRWLFFWPGLLLLGIGASGLVWLLPGPRTISGITFDIHTLLYACAAFLLGTQVLFFSLVARLVTHQLGLVPASSFTPPSTRHLLEWGLVLSLLLAVLGVGLGAGAVLTWRTLSYGELDPSVVLRWVIPSVFCLLLAGQTFWQSFVLGLLHTSWLRQGE